MTSFNTRDLKPESSLSADLNHQIYCGLDSCVTVEVLEQLQKQFPQPPAIYSFERALQAPLFEMMRRGFAVDQQARAQEATALRGRIGHLCEAYRDPGRQYDGPGVLDEYARAVWDKGLNPRSFKQLEEFFYRKLQLPEVWIREKGVARLSTNREALEKLSEYLHARPFINAILRVRTLAKQLDVFENKVDADGRFRTSYNMGTETGRLSSSKNAFGTGGNAQNIAQHLRYVFVSDPGYKLFSIDYEQVEARDVGYFCGCLFDDWTYLDNCESGDLHTNNAKMIWPQAVTDRQSADKLFYRDMTYRDMSKRGGHATNYYATDWTLARHLKIPQAVAADFQALYCKGGRLQSGEQAVAAFPAIPRLWQWIALQLQTTRQLCTPFGRRRHFFARPGDDATLREAIAFMPQSTTADRTNLALFRIWKKMPEVQVLAQTHDSITFQAPEGQDAAIVKRALELMRVELKRPSGQPYVVPGEAKVGWNWGPYASPEDVEAGRSPRPNPGGLRKFKPGQAEDRVRPQAVHVLDRLIGGR